MRRPVVDGLDVGPVRVEDVGGVVARVVVAFAGRAVVPTARRERRGVEAAHGALVLGLEREMQALGRRPVGGDEELVGEEVALPRDDLAAERAERRLVEAPAPFEVGDAEVDVVDEAAEVMLPAPSVPARASGAPV